MITHGLAVVSGVSHRVALMQAGATEEQGAAAEVLQAPQRAHTRALLDAVPRLSVGR